MYPRTTYYPEAHGYYYFRPYNYVHVAQQQAIAVGWGADPRNPYSNEMFQGIYRQLEVPYYLPEEVSPPSLPRGPATGLPRVGPAPSAAPVQPLPGAQPPTIEGSGDVPPPPPAADTDPTARLPRGSASRVRLLTQ
jgi:hypothetical protein